MQEEKPNYYSIIPANIRYDKTLKANAKLLYGEITALTNKEGFCWASNAYFSDLFEVTPQAISNWIKALSCRGYVDIEYVKSGKEIVSRKIYLSEKQRGINKCLQVSTKSEGGINKRLRGYQQKVKGNNTINNTINNKEATQATRSSFKIPSIEEIGEYCKERKNGIDPETFWCFYNSKGWKVGNTKMKSWKDCVITWEKRQKTERKNGQAAEVGREGYSNEF